MPDKTYDTSGLLRYRIWIRVVAPEWEHEITFNAYGPAVPRVGERLVFHGDFNEELTARATEIDHSWHRPAYLANPVVTVAAEVVEGLELAIRLADSPDALGAWVRKFPYLEPIDPTTEV
ncbi:hypothetical protein [Nocardia otitidiscaviarum]|uniref:hypothetical protein n=1 Tax=Nocardia otitidiscaviarum TaxID=1823 RepID=UPI00245767C5|nr:hypothetical protein [Nocardia otitidiscaviarum]